MFRSSMVAATMFWPARGKRLTRGSGSSSPTICWYTSRARPRESPLEFGEALAILVELGLELLQLRELCGLVVLRWGVDLFIIPRGPGIFPCYGSSSTSGGILRVVRGSHGPVNVEALPRRVVAVGFRVGIWLGGVEASASLLHQLLPERDDGVPSGS